MGYHRMLRRSIGTRVHYVRFLCSALGCVFPSRPGWTHTFLHVMFSLDLDDWLSSIRTIIYPFRATTFSLRAEKLAASLSFAVASFWLYDKGVGVVRPGAKNNPFKVVPSKSSKTMPARQEGLIEVNEEFRVSRTPLAFLSLFWSAWKVPS